MKILKKLLLAILSLLVVESVNSSSNVLHRVAKGVEAFRSVRPGARSQSDITALGGLSENFTVTQGFSKGKNLVSSQTEVNVGKVNQPTPEDIRAGLIEEAQAQSANARQKELNRLAAEDAFKKQKEEFRQMASETAKIAEEGYVNSIKTDLIKQEQRTAEAEAAAEVLKQAKLVQEQSIKEQKKARELQKAIRKDNATRNFLEAAMAENVTGSAMAKGRTYSGPADVVLSKGALEAAARRAFDQIIKDNAGGFGYGDAISNTAAGAGLIGSALVGAGVSNLINQKAAERAAAGEAADEIVDGFLNYNDEEAALRKELMDQKEAKMRQVYGDTLDGLVDLADLAYQAQADYEASINDKNASIKEVRERREEANALLNELAAREAIVAERLTHNGLDTGFNTQAEKVQYLKDFMKVNRAEIQKRIGYLGRGKDMITDSRIGLRSAYNATADKFADAVDYSGLNRLGNSIVNSSLYNSLANGLSNVSESARNRWNGLKDWYANRRLVNVDLNVGQVK